MDELTAYKQLARGTICFGCGLPFTPEIADQPCSSSHRENWPHEWVNLRVIRLTEKCMEHLNEIDRLKGLLAMGQHGVPVAGPISELRLFLTREEKELLDQLYHQRKDENLDLPFEEFVSTLLRRLIVLERDRIIKEMENAVEANGCDEAGPQV